jgi:N-carbamoylputrescine amidase
MSRNVRIATCSVNYAPGVSSQETALALVERAGRMGSDIVCLPEFSAAPVRAGQFAAEPVPGPAVEAFAALAAKYKTYVIVPMLEDVGRPKHYNTAVLLDRGGRVVGKYRKTHLCHPVGGESETTCAGDELPVFKTDFGTIGVSICMDIHYPELYTTLALKGAEVIFWPSAAMDYTGDLIESIVNARAVDNQVYFVASHFVQAPYLVGKHYGRSRVVDCTGRVRADTGHFEGLALAEVDLDQTYPMWYQGQQLEDYPTMRQTIFRTRRPELYGQVTQPRRKD